MTDEGDYRGGLVESPAWVAWRRERGEWVSVGSDDNRLALMRRFPRARILEMGEGPPPDEIKAGVKRPA